MTYAPDRPELGVRDSPARFFGTGIHPGFVWAGTLVVALGTVSGTWSTWRR
ncbi:hypothetical protein [Streptomyces sp. MST-110588]|uniref:hypothetical protein n=1 Tax=Streptomyces sp. MST-110588 TaxID=2833628 RepID=UPI001F5E00F7|nr:hypothetical protein [Streptomyces sp. MST-110588]UNO39244.1 hypothetical protein KGS77_05910 [Streptomyces sp. MST-110588]